MWFFIWKMQQITIDLLSIVDKFWQEYECVMECKNTCNTILGSPRSQLLAYLYIIWTELKKILHNFLETIEM